MGTNYRDSHLLTTLLIRGDEDVVRWAIANPKTSGLRLRAPVAASPTVLADQVTRNIISAKDMTGMEAMVRVYTNNL